MAEDVLDLAPMDNDSTESVDETAISELWYDEAERRYAEYKAGRMTAQLAEEVMAEARKRLL